MAAKSLDKEISETVIAEWRTGKYSQQNLADRHRISKGVVNKLCKGVDQDMTAIVTAGIQYQRGLLEQDDRIVTAVTAVVDDAVKRQEWLNMQALQNVKEAMTLPCENQNDFRARADTISKAKDVVIGKTPDTAIQINNNAETKPLSRADFYS